MYVLSQSTQPRYALPHSRHASPRSRYALSQSTQIVREQQDDTPSPAEDTVQRLSGTFPLSTGRDVALEWCVRGTLCGAFRLRTQGMGAGAQKMCCLQHQSASVSIQSASSQHPRNFLRIFIVSNTSFLCDAAPDKQSYK